MTISVVLAVVVSMALFGGSFLMTKQVDRLSSLFIGQIDTLIYLCDGRECPEITEAQRLALEQELLNEPHVVTATYIDKQAAYERFVELFENQPDLVETVVPEALPASYDIKLTDPDKFELVLSKYSDWPGVESVFDQREIVDQIQSVGSVFQVGSLAIAIVQLIAAGVLVTMTIQVTAFARRDQTAIMKLVGASNWYIGLPFMLEGIIACLVGALIAWGVLWVLVPIGTGFVSEQIPWVPFVGTKDILRAGPLLVLIATAVAVVSSTIALYRHADV
ncbi:MAG: permease-like cell division protein FtsX, partial [Nitriliruptorales bacterium]|nr:permease-like cell division protein FtsX [Nitriliruptorales bacterium]